MPRAPRGLILAGLLLSAGTFIIAPPVPPTQGALLRLASAKDDDTEELRQKVLEGEHDEAVSAAIELFTTGKPRYDGKHDAFLEGVLKPTNGSPERHASSARSRRAVIEAIGLFGRYRAQVACRLARLGVSDPDAEVRSAAANALAGIEHPETYRFLAEAVRALAKTNPGTTEPRDLDTLLGVIERKRDPIAATGVLIEALPVFEGAEEQKLRAPLKRLTGRSFDTDDEWARWYADHKGIPQREWYLEALKAAEDSNEKAATDAARVFEKLLAALAKDEQALLRELEDALTKDSIPSVRASAIRNLGLLGARPGTAGDRAVGLLENLVKQVGSRKPATPGETDETTIAAALGGLGRTARATELPVILPFLEHAARPVRLAAIGALGALRAEGCVAPLVKALAAQPGLEVRDVEAAAIFARSLGLVGRDPESKSSGCLLAFVERVQTGEVDKTTGVCTGVPKESRPPLLQAAAEALGGLGPALAADGEGAAAVVSCLAALSEPAQHQDVRWWATTSLGRIPHRRALEVLATRVHDEVQNVRRAAVGAIGLQARRPNSADALVRDGVLLLATELAGTDEALKRAARAELDEVVAHDTQTFFALDALVDALARRGAPDLAAPFLDGLPVPDKISDAQKKAIGRYWSLLEARAGARLRLQDGRGAASDFELLLAAPQAVGQRQHTFMLGRAKALLAAGDTRAAAERAAELARLDPKDDAAWACLRQAADALLGRGERIAVKEVLASVDRALPQASTEVQAGFQETLRRATDTTPPPKNGATDPPPGSPKPPGAKDKP